MQMVAQTSGYPSQGQVRVSSSSSRKGRNAPPEAPMLSVQEQEALNIRWTELDAMKQSSLRKAGRAAGIRQEALDSLEDSRDPKTAIIKLIMTAETQHLRQRKPTSYRSPDGNWVHRSGVGVYEQDVNSKHRLLPKVLQTRLGRPSKPMSRSTPTLMNTPTLPDLNPPGLKQNFRPGRGAEEELTGRIKHLEAIFLATRENNAREVYMSDRIQELSKPRIKETKDHVRESPITAVKKPREGYVPYIPMSPKERKAISGDLSLQRTDTMGELEKRLDKILQKDATTGGGEAQKVPKVSKSPSSSSLKNSRPDSKNSRPDSKNSRQDSKNLGQNSEVAFPEAGEEKKSERAESADSLNNAEEAEYDNDKAEEESKESSERSSPRSRSPRSRSPRSRSPRSRSPRSRSRSRESTPRSQRSSRRDSKGSRKSGESDNYSMDDFSESQASFSRTQSNQTNPQLEKKESDLDKLDENDDDGVEPTPSDSQKEESNVSREPSRPTSRGEVALTAPEAVEDEYDEFEQSGKQAMSQGTDSEGLEKKARATLAEATMNDNVQTALDASPKTSPKAETEPSSHKEDTSANNEETSDDSWQQQQEELEKKARDSLAEATMNDQTEEALSPKTSPKDLEKKARDSLAEATMNDEMEEALSPKTSPKAEHHDATAESEATSPDLEKKDRDSLAEATMNDQMEDALSPKTSPKAKSEDQAYEDQAYDSEELEVEHEQEAEHEQKKNEDVVANSEPIRPITPKTNEDIEVNGKMEYDDDDDFEATQSSVATTPKATSPGNTKMPTALGNAKDADDDDDEFEASQTPAQTPVAGKEAKKGTPTESKKAPPPVEQPNEEAEEVFDTTAIFQSEV